MANSCNIVNQRIRNIASELKQTPEETLAQLNLYQNIMHTAEVPSASALRFFIDSVRENEHIDQYKKTAQKQQTIDKDIFPENEGELMSYPQDERLKALAGNSSLKDLSFEDLLTQYKGSEYDGLKELLSYYAGTVGFEFLKDIKVKFAAKGTTYFANGSKRAYYNAADHMIIINPYAGYRNGNAESVIMHEVMHYMTVGRLAANPEMRKEFEAILEEYRKNGKWTKYAYSEGHAIEEFVADIWTNPDVIKELISIKTKTHSSLWAKIKDFFKRLFSAPSDSLMAKASDSLIKLLDSEFTVDVQETFAENEVIRTFSSASINNSETEAKPVITFKTTGSNAYSERTKDNADWSDITISFAEDFTSAGETLTARYAGNKDKNYLGGRQPMAIKDKHIPIDLKNTTVEKIVEEIERVREEKQLPKQNIKLNIAGNSIKTLQGPQQDYDDLMFSVLTELQNAGYTFEEVRSGGQTGMDEAGAKAAARLGIPTTVVTTNNWKYLPKNGKDIENDQQGFIARFNATAKELKGLLTEESLTAKKTFTRKGVSYPVEIGTIVDSDGNPAGVAARKTSDGKIVLDMEMLKRKYEDKAWVHPRVQADKSMAKPLRAGIFRSFNDFLTFTVLHEFYHTQLTQKDFYNETNNSTIGAYETKINEMALEDLSNNYDRGRNDKKEISIPKSSYEPTYSMEDAAKESDKVLRYRQAYVNAVERQDRIDMISRDFSGLLESLRGQADKLLFGQINDAEKDYADSKSKFLKNTIRRLKRKRKALQGDYGDIIALNMFYGTRTGLQEIVSQLKEMYVYYTDPQEYTNQELVNDYGVRPGEEDKFRASYAKMVDNFDMLLKDALLDIEYRENIAIDLDSNLADTNIDDTEIDELEYDDDETGDRVNGSEGWSFKTRLTDPYMTTARKVKKYILNDIKRVHDILDEDGNPIYIQNMGNPRYYSGSYIHSVLIHELSRLTEISQFFYIDDAGNAHYPVLDNLQAKYPWMIQVKDKLESERLQGRDQIVAMFYNTFRMDFIPYWIHKVENNNISTIPINMQSTTAAAYEQVMNDSTLGVKHDDYSLYTVDGGADLTHKQFAEKLYNDVREAYKNSETSEEAYIKFKNDMEKLLNMFGFTVSHNAITGIYDSEERDDYFTSILDSMRIVIAKMDEVKNDMFVDHFNFQYKNIASKIGVVNELDQKKSVRQGKKTFYSYSTPNYFDTQLKRLSNPNTAERRAYIEKRYMPYKFFYQGDMNDFDARNWRNNMLAELYGDPDSSADRSDASAQLLTTMHLIELDGVEYDNWTTDQITSSFIAQFYAADANSEAGSARKTAWYSSPIFSDSPVAKFYKFIRYHEGYKDTLKYLMEDTVHQEMWRIKLVQERKANHSQEILHFDDKGKSFCFFPELNDLVINFKGEDVKFTDLDKLKPSEEELSMVIQNAIEQIMDEGFQKFYATYITNEVTAKLKASLSKKEGEEEMSDDTLKALVEEYYWNQYFANTQIIQLLTTDLAFYKNAVDFQKRWKEVYASGKRLNTSVKYGKKYENTIYLRDRTMTSYSYEGIKRSFDRAVEEGRLTPEMRDRFLKGAKDICTTDGQAYRSITSFRSVMAMMGTWDASTMDDAYDRIKQGEWTEDDLTLMWNTIKPFLFSNLDKPTGTANAELFGESMLVPHQNKNSEALILSLMGAFSYAQQDNEQLKGLERFMEMRGIDLVQFESSGKIGPQGTIDINYSRKSLNHLKYVYEKDYDANRLTKHFMEGDTSYVSIQKDASHIEEKNGVRQITAEWNEIQQDAEKANVSKNATDFEIYKAALDYRLDNKKIDQQKYIRLIEDLIPSADEVVEILDTAITTAPENKNISLVKMEATEDTAEYDYNPEVLHRINYEDYMVAQPTPSHLVDAKVVFGSQFRNLIESDLLAGSEFNVHGERWSKSKLKKTYKELIVENLLDDFEDLVEHFGNIETLQKYLQKTVRGNPKYGKDIMNAIEIVTRTRTENIGGVPTTVRYKTFNIPLNNPATTKKLQEIVNAVFKNHIQKQHIHGGAAILASSFGKSKDLKIQYGPNGNVEYAEAMLPAWARAFFTEYINEDGVLDIDSVPEDLKKMIAYRIPTEHKYSMLPLKIVGFLPAQAGAQILLPADTIFFSGEDFDVDKKFLMMPSFELGNLKLDDALEAFAETPAGSHLTENQIDDIRKAMISGEVDEENYDLQNFLDFIAEKPEFGHISIKKIEYDTNKAVSEQYSEILEEAKTALDRAQITYDETVNASATEEQIEKAKKALDKAVKDYNRAKKNQKRKARAARDNMLMDISWAVLTHPDSAEQIAHSGNFDSIKRAGKVSRILENPQIINDLMSEETSGTAYQRRKRVSERVIDMSDDELSALLDKYKVTINTCAPGTFQYFHKQNMTGAALIGMYANAASMNAKYQESGIALKKDYAFNINGKHIQDMSAQMVASVRPYDNKLISYNCAEFIGASVDNAKDPNLAYLKQNTKTANYTSTMIRLGMSIEEVGLMFAHPAIRRLIEIGERMDLDMLKSEKIASEIREFCLFISQIPSEKDPNVMLTVTDDSYSRNITSADLADAITGYDMLFNYKQLRDAGEITDSDILDIIAKTLAIFDIWMKVSEVTKDMKDINRHSRMDSPNGALLPTLAQGKAQIRTGELIKRKIINNSLSVTGLDSVPMTGMVPTMYYEPKLEYNASGKYSAVLPKSSKDSIREKLLQSAHPSLQAFFSLGIEAHTTLEKQYMPQLQETFDSLVDEILDMSKDGNLSIERYYQGQLTMDDLYQEITTFALASTKLFGDDENASYEEKRYYYIYNFPMELLQKIKEMPKEIQQNAIIQRLSVNKGKLQLASAHSSDPVVRENLMNAMDELATIRDAEGNELPEGRKIVEDLFKYYYYTEQLNFSPRSAGAYFSSVVLERFPEFLNALDSVNDIIRKPEYRRRFKDQFVRQHAYSLLPYRTISKNVVKIDDDTIHVASTNYSIFNFNLQEPSPYEYIYLAPIKNEKGKIIVKGGTFKAYGPMDGSSITYKRLETFELYEYKQQVRDFIKYNPNKEAMDMENASKFDKDIWNELKKQKNFVNKVFSQEEQYKQTTWYTEDDAEFFSDYRNSRVNVDNPYSESDISNVPEQQAGYMDSLMNSSTVKNTPQSNKTRSQVLADLQKKVDDGTHNLEAFENIEDLDEDDRIRRELQSIVDSPEFIRLSQLIEDYQNNIPIIPDGIEIYDEQQSMTDQDLTNICNFEKLLK